MSSTKVQYRSEYIQPHRREAMDICNLLLHIVKWSPGTSVTQTVQVAIQSHLSGLDETFLKLRVHRIAC